MEEEIEKKSELVKDENPLTVWQCEEIDFHQTKKIKRLSFRHLLTEIGGAFNFDKGFLATFIGLTIRPAKTVRSYLDLGRFTVTSPLRYFLFIVGFTLFVAFQTDYFEDSGSFLDDIQVTSKDGSLTIGTGNTTESTDSIKEENINEENGLESDVKDEAKKQKLNELNENVQSGTQKISKLLDQYQNVWTFLLIFYFSLFSLMFFKKCGYNLTEHTVINIYAYTHTYLVFTFMVIFDIKNDNLTIFQNFLFVTLVIYLYKRLFGMSWLATISRGLFAFIIAFILFLVIMTLAVIGYFTIVYGA